MADGRVTIRVELEDEGVSSELDGIQGDISGLDGAAKKSSISLGKIAGALGLVAAGAGAFSMIKDGISSAFDRIDTMNQFEIVMSRILGSSEEAASALDGLNEIVLGTSYGLDTAATSFQRFITSGSDTEKATKAVQVWGDAVAFYAGSSPEIFDRVTNAMSEMSANGTANMENIRTLTESQIPVWKLWEEQTGESMADFQKRLSKGEVSSEEFQTTLQGALYNAETSLGSVEGAAKEMGGGIRASFSQMQSAITRGAQAIILATNEVLAENGLPSMEEMIKNVGTAFETALGWVANTLLPLISDGIGNVIKFVKEFDTELEVLAVTAGSVLVVLGAVATWNAIVAGVKAVTVAIKGMNLALLANPWTWVAAAAIAAIYLIIKYWDELVAYFSEQWEEIKEVAKLAWDYIVEVSEPVVTWLKEAWGEFTDWFSEKWTQISEWFSQAWQSMQQAVTEVYEYLQPYIENFVANFQAIWEELKQFWDELWTALKELGAAIWDPLQERIQGFIDFFTQKSNETSEFWSGLWEGIKNVVSTAWEFIKNVTTPIIEFFAQIWENIKTNVEEIWNAITEYFSNTWTNITETATEIWESFKEWFSTYLDTFVEVAKAGWELFKEIILGIIRGLTDLLTEDWEGFKENLQAIWEALKQFGETTWQAFSDFFVATWEFLRDSVLAIWDAIVTQLENVWNLIIEIGTELWEGFREWFETLWNGLKEFISNTWNNIKSTIRNIANNIWETVKNAWNKVVENTKTQFKNVYNAIKDKLEDAWDKVKETKDNIIDTFENLDLFQIGKDIIQGLINGIRDKIQDVKNAVTDVTSSITNKVKDILKLGSPSRWFRDEVGKMMMEGLMIGVEMEESQAVQQAEQVMKEIMAAFQNTPMSDLVGNAVNYAKSAASNIRGQLGQGAQQINNNAPGIEVLLEYNGDGFDVLKDARRMVGAIDIELSNRTDIAAWLKGFRAQRGSY